MNEMKYECMKNGWKCMFSPTAVLKVFLFIVVVMVSIAGAFLSYPEGDIIEHIHASFLVSEGKVPYRDFFEHHHPLLWYLTSDLVGKFYGDSSIVLVLNCLTLMVFLVGGYFLYKIIVEFLGDKDAGFLSLILILLPGVWLYYLYFKPDNYMIVCLVIGIYYLFCYLRDNKRRDLVISFGCFAIGFLFLQKILLYVPSVGGVVLYYLYKKEIKVKDFAIALGCALAIVGMGALWLFKEGIFDIYYKSCFEFNKELVSYAGEMRFIKPDDLYVVVFVMGLLFGGCLFFIKDKYFRIWYFIGAFCLATKWFYFAPHLYYYYEAFYFLVVVMMVSLVELAKKNKMLLWVIIFQLQVYAIIQGYYIYFDVVKAKKFEFSSLLEDGVSRCDYVLYSFFNGNLWQKDLVSYWFLLGETDVIGEKVGIRKKDDFNRLIEDKKPKYLYVQDIYDRFLKVDDKEVLSYKFDYEMIDKYYEKLGEKTTMEYDSETKTMELKEVDGGLYKLKKEYQKKDCKMSLSSGEWEYAKN